MSLFAVLSGLVPAGAGIARVGPSDDLNAVVVGDHVTAAAAHTFRAGRPPGAAGPPSSASGIALPASDTAREVKR